ncbi:phosphotransferase enzyme family protein [Pseudactinotalea sp. Z1748]|uniref:phosphotransferase enzyme family protein n=1 Tax=Pseudactinotalea sp. Z1748 TaxID=3413027 RepID=UPI003C7AE56C
MFAPGLSMLWERVDAARALTERFGFADLPEMSHWLTDVLRWYWSLQVRQVECIVLSDHNAIAWTHTDRGIVVVKACADATRFDRLGLIADVVAQLGEVGLPVAAPRPASDGSTRVVLQRSAAGSERHDGLHDDAGPVAQAGAATAASGTHDQPLSVIVQPLVPGTLLDAGDLAGVRAAGVLLARLHTAVAHLPRAGHRVGEPDLHRRLHRAVAGPARHRVPRAADRLDALVADLPALGTPTQLVHHDFRGTNVLMNGPEVSAVLDFDEMALDHPVLDLALACTLLATRYTTWDPAPPAARESLVAGYRSVRPLSDLEERWLGALALGLSIAQVLDGRNPAGWTQAAQHLSAGL